MRDKDGPGRMLCANTLQAARSHPAGRGPADLPGGRVPVQAQCHLVAARGSPPSPAREGPAFGRRPGPKATTSEGCPGPGLEKPQNLSPGWFCSGQQRVNRPRTSRPPGRCLGPGGTSTRNSREGSREATEGSDRDHGPKVTSFRRTSQLRTATQQTFPGVRVSPLGGKQVLRATRACGLDTCSTTRPERGPA